MMATIQDDVLIVEDEALIGFDLADLFASAGYRVRGPFASADEALKAVERSVPRLAILDVNLGDGSTSERVAEALRVAGTPMVFVSGYTPRGNPVLRRFSDALWITKPWDPDELLTTVGRYLAREAAPAA